jgi:RNA polymerase sigma-70 factor (ECF subfamily)
MESKATIQPAWQTLTGELYAFINSKVHDKAIADDLMQEVYIKAHSRIDSLKDSEKIQGWIFQIARNTVWDHLRKEKYHQTLNEIEELNEVSYQGAMTEALQDMVKMMDKLPPEYCDVLCKAELGGMKLQDYAKETGISHTAARTRAHRARKMLKDLLLQCCHYQFDVYGTIIDIQSNENCCCCCKKGNNGC